MHSSPATAVRVARGVLRVVSRLHRRLDFFRLLFSERRVPSASPLLVPASWQSAALRWHKSTEDTEHRGHFSPRQTGGVPRPQRPEHRTEAGIHRCRHLPHYITRDHAAAADCFFTHCCARVALTPCCTHDTAAVVGMLRVQHSVRCCLPYQCSATWSAVLLYQHHQYYCCLLHQYISAAVFL